MRVKEI
jgi:hypothetical protein